MLELSSLESWLFLDQNVDPEFPNLQTYHWHFGPDSCLLRETVLCIAEFLAIFLVLLSRCQWQPTSYNNQNVCSHFQVSLWWWDHPCLGAHLTSWVIEKNCGWISYKLCETKRKWELLISNSPNIVKSHQSDVSPKHILKEK